LDESIYSRQLRDAMVAAGSNVEHVGGGVVPKGADDQTWLAAAGQHGWIALSRDKMIRKRRIELEALRDAGVAAFTFTGGQATAAATAEVIVPLLRKFANMATSEPKPFLYTFGLSGRLSKVKLK
jgi:hypothetical protein